MTTSVDLGIPYIASKQGTPEVTHNDALNLLQMLVSGVADRALDTPPGSPAQGDTYILGSSPTGAWAGHANKLAGWFGTAWVFLPGNDSAGTPMAIGARHEGLAVWVRDEDRLYVWSGSAWLMQTAGQVQNGSATYDAPNLAAAATTTTTVTVTGAALGDLAIASLGVSLAGIMLTAYVSAADTVTVVLFNPTAGSIDLGSATLRARVFKV
jgi:hypothetical protein